MEQFFQAKDHSTVSQVRREMFSTEKILILLMILAAILCLVACTPKIEEIEEIDEVGEVGEIEEGKLPGKIFIITCNNSDYYEYNNVPRLVAQKYETEEMYGQMHTDLKKKNGFLISTQKGDNIIYANLDPNDGDHIARLITQIAADSEVKVLIFNPAIWMWGSLDPNEAINKLRETRDDILVIYCNYYDYYDDDDYDYYDEPIADIVLKENYLKIGYTTPAQAAKMGAKTLVFYSYARYTKKWGYTEIHDIMKTECERLGMEFVDGIIPDPNPDGNDFFMTTSPIPGDVAEKVAQYGKNTAFFGEHWGVHPSLIRACFEERAIYLPEDPWALYDFVKYDGLNIDISDKYDDSWWSDGMYWGNFRDYIIDQISQEIAGAGLGGRFATFPMVYPILLTMAAADYGVQWMKGKVPKEGVDIEALRECLEAYTGPGIDIEAYKKDGNTYENFLLVMQPYLTFGK